MLVADGVAVVKVHLHVGPELQQRRIRRLHKDPTTRWRVTAEDHWAVRHYARVERVLEHCLEVTEQPCAPWHVVDGTDRQHRALEVGRTLLAGIEGEAGRRDKPALPAAAVLRRRAARVRLVTNRRGERVAEEDYDRRLEDLQGRLALLSRRRRFARHSVVLVFEGWDAAGKGGAIKRLTVNLDPRGYDVNAVAAPTREEKARHYLWRFWRDIPKDGHLTIFDRSWYGRVVVERIEGFCSADDWRRAYQEINEFERQLAEHGAVICKFWLHISPEEQLARFRARERTPLKRHKITDEDWRNRARWPQYLEAVTDMLRQTSTSYAPWTIVEANDKRHARLEVLRGLCDRIEAALG